jgi:hypothetical protein
VLFLDVLSVEDTDNCSVSVTHRHIGIRDVTIIAVACLYLYGCFDLFLSLQYFDWDRVRDAVELRIPRSVSTV